MLRRSACTYAARAERRLASHWPKTLTRLQFLEAPLLVQKAALRSHLRRYLRIFTDDPVPHLPDRETSHSLTRPCAAGCVLDMPRNLFRGAPHIATQTASHVRTSELLVFVRRAQRRRI